MPSVYPRAETKKAIEVVGDGTLAERIVTAREADPSATRASVVGACLAGSDDVRGYYRVWDEIEAERIALTAVRVADYATLTKFKAALSVAATSGHIDVTKWVDGLKDVAGVSTWTELKALATEAEQVAVEL